MKNKLFSVLSVLLLTVFLFTGCDKSEDNPLNPGGGGNNNTSGNNSG